LKKISTDALFKKIKIKKIEVLFFFTHKPIFLSKTPRKYPRDLVKPIHDHKKYKKSPLNPKST